MKFIVRIAFILGISFITLINVDAQGCKKSCGMASLCSTDKTEEYLKRDEVIACYTDCNLFSAEYGKAKLIEKKSTGEFEIEWLTNSNATQTGTKATVNKVIIKSHIPSKDEMKTGIVALYGDGSKFRTGIVKEFSASTGKVLLEWFSGPLDKINTTEQEIKNIRIIDEPVMKDPRK
jgi:hypothetical protein